MGIHAPQEKRGGGGVTKVDPHSVDESLNCLYLTAAVGMEKQRFCSLPLRHHHRLQKEKE